jgi:hypothetical protein
MPYEAGSEGGNDFALADNKESCVVKDWPTSKQHFSVLGEPGIPFSSHNSQNGPVRAGCWPHRMMSI